MSFRQLILLYHNMCYFTVIIEDLCKWINVNCTCLEIVTIPSRMNSFKQTENMFRKNVKILILVNRKKMTFHCLCASWVLLQITIKTRRKYWKGNLCQYFVNLMGVLDCLSKSICLYGFSICEECKKLQSLISRA